MIEISADQLRTVLPFAGRFADTYAAPLTQACAEFEISTAARVAAFVAQIGHESGQLHYVRELATGAAYEGRRDLGNTEPGDGPRFRGRGLIQCTGRTNYRQAGAALGLDCEVSPELLEEPINACRVSAWWWHQHGLNELADRGEFQRITFRINGGTNGLADRLALWSRAKTVFGVAT